MRAFTLFEVLIVLGVFLAVAAFTLFMGIDSIARGSVTAERDMFVSLLLTQRTASLVNRDALPHGVRIDANQFTMFDGASYTALPASYKTIARNAAVSVTGVTLPLDIVFTQLSATTTAVGPITFVGTPASLSVDINSEGRVEW